MATANHVERARQDGVLLGIPLGDLGWFQFMLIGVATGFAAFFATTFFAIMGFLFYSGATHRTPDYSLTYRAFGLPVGAVVMVLALSYLGLQQYRQVRRRLAAKHESSQR